MINLCFLAMLALATGMVLYWGFRNLPGRHWQFAATLPRFDTLNNSWQGYNLTWYGLLTATACLASVVLILSLLGGIGVSHQATLLLAVTLLIACLVAAKGLAALIEGKAHTFSVGAAAFVGFVLAPWIITAVNRLLPAGAGASLPMLPTLAALTAGYAFGEGLGRLACISFGCCYGKPHGPMPTVGATPVQPLAFPVQRRYQKDRLCRRAGGPAGTAGAGPDRHGLLRHRAACHRSIPDGAVRRRVSGRRPG